MKLSRFGGTMVAVCYHYDQILPCSIFKVIDPEDSELSEGDIVYLHTEAVESVEKYNVLSSEAGSLIEYMEEIGENPQWMQA